MPLAFSKYDVVLAPLAEGVSAKRSLPGELDLCENAAFPKGGRIDKRRGYALIDAQTAADGTAIDPSNVFHAAGVYWGELCIMGHDTMWSLAPGEGTTIGRLVPRGPVFRGNGELLAVASASLNDTEPS